MSIETDSRPHPSVLPAPKRNGHAIIESEVDESDDELTVRLQMAMRAGRTEYERAQIARSWCDLNFSSSDNLNHASLAEALLEQEKKMRHEINSQWIIWLGKILLNLDFYACKQREARFVRMSIRTMAYILSYGELLGVKSFTDIAVKLNLAQKNSGKATVNKCAQYFLEQLKLAPMLTQRTAAARKEMENARNGQIKKPKN